MSAFNPNSPPAGKRLGLGGVITGLALGSTVLINALVASAAPPEVFDVPEWAERNRIVGKESQSRYAGKWSNDRQPMLVEIMEACQIGNGVRLVVITGSAQFGKSEVPINAMGQNICGDSPVSWLVVLPSDNEVRTYSRAKWEANVLESPAWRAKVHARKSRSGDGTTSKVKKFDGGTVELVTAGSSKNLQMRTVGAVIAEECSQYAVSEDGKSGEGGDPIDAAEARMKTFGDEAKTILVSTPGFAHNCRITREYNLSDMRRWHAPCPHCDHFIVLDFRTLSESEGRPVFSCTACGGVIEEAHKKPMNARGVWIATFAHPGASPDDDDETAAAKEAKRAANPAPPKEIPAADIPHWRQRPTEGRARGYHLWQAQSNLASWSEILTDWKKVQRGEKDAIEFDQKTLGIPHEAKVDRPDHEKLFNVRGRVYPKAGVVPPWASMVTGAIDVQHNRVEWAVYAWGSGGVGARIASGVIPKNPADWRTWADDVHDLVSTSFRGPHYLPRRCDYWGIDSGGHWTDNVSTFCYGHAAERVLMLKGSSHDKGDAPALERGKKSPVYFQGRRIGKVQLWFVGTHTLKARVYFGLAQGHLSAENDPPTLEPRSLHYPAEATLQEFAQLTAEHLEQVPGKRAHWVHSGKQANEQLDLAVYCLALAINEGLDRLDQRGWADRASSRAPDLVAADVPLLAGAGVHVPDEPEAPALVAPKAEGTMRQGLSAEAKAKLVALGRKMAGR